MGFVNAALSWAVLAMGIGVPTIAILDGAALANLTGLELERNGVTGAERAAALRPMRRYVALGVCAALLFGVACFITRTGHGNAGMALGVPGGILWRWAMARADKHADQARRAARAAAPRVTPREAQVVPPS